MFQILILISAYQSSKNWKDVIWISQFPKKFFIQFQNLKSYFKQLSFDILGTVDEFVDDIFKIRYKLSRILSRHSIIFHSPIQPEIDMSSFLTDLNSALSVSIHQNFLPFPTMLSVITAFNGQYWKATTLYTPNTEVPFFLRISSFVGAIFQQLPRLL